MNPVVYFEIPVTDLPRARHFYEAVLGTTLDLAEVDGNQMALFAYAEGRPGASGALACGPSYVPGREGVRVYFTVADIDATLAHAVRLGAQSHYPVTEVPGYGWVAEFIDTEGNCIALHAAQRTGSGSSGSHDAFDPVAGVQRQLDAYNARDLERFVAEYTDDVVVYRLPAVEPVLVGRAALAAHYRANRFSLPGLHAEVVNRMVLGNKVIDHERVVGVEPEPMEVVAIYEVTPQGIAKVWFVSGR